MNLDEIKQVIELMKSNDLAEFELESGDFRLVLRRRTGAEGVSGGAPNTLPVSTASAIAPPAPSTTPGPSTASEVADAESKWVDIKAPIVGTFYRAPSPDAEPFVTVGQEVDEDTVVAIIEAMKVMNEIKAEVRGIIRKVCVDNATPVQYGQVLFKVEPI